jgi:hypothetical protein
MVSKLRISSVSPEHVVHTIELSLEGGFLTVYTKGVELPFEGNHNPKLFHADDNECYWVNDLEENGHEKTWYKHYHFKLSETDSVFKVLDIDKNLRDFVTNFIRTYHGTDTTTPRPD